eukprot:CCRYP_002711-RA/>CCRYP_002711-RA protein AED:0.47 eAED:0.65 QI:0/0/0/1/0/0/2/0/77
MTTTLTPLYQSEWSYWSMTSLTADNLLRNTARKAPQPNTIAAGRYGHLSPDQHASEQQYSSSINTSPIPQSLLQMPS